MKFNIPENMAETLDEPKIGNVYKVNGGYGARLGHVHVLIAKTDTGGVYLTINKNGEIITGGSYGLHYFLERKLIGFCDGLSELNFDIRFLP